MRAQVKLHQSYAKKDSDVDYQAPRGLAVLANAAIASEISATLLTGGSDKPYVFGIVTELISKGATLDLIGSDELDVPEFRGKPRINFINLRGDQRSNARFVTKVRRICAYYGKLLRYAASAKPRIFHILWNNRFQLFDRTLLMLYYRCLGKRIVITTHNVNQRKRDGTDTFLNRLTLRMQYRLADHIFVHTERMKSELATEFGVQGGRITVIPFGINNAVPNTHLTAAEAKRRLGIRDQDKTILFFGRIAPYKGLEYLVNAFKFLSPSHDYRLIIAGRPEKGCEGYLAGIQETIREETQRGRILLKPHFIPDDEIEVYFKAADVLVLPYRDVYQSGVLFLGYSFGLPVLASDVGSLKEGIVEGRTGWAFRPGDADDLARAIETYFASLLYAKLDERRQEIRDYATARHSWDRVGQITMNVYGHLLRLASSGVSPNREASTVSVDLTGPHEIGSGRASIQAAIKNADSR